MRPIAIVAGQQSYPAVAPARNPFLWNATRQSRTQWLGFASNASSMDRLGRNVGQVYGVFARFGVHRRTGDENRRYRPEAGFSKQEAHRPAP